MKARALILAAGKGKRMKSQKSKVLHEINGKTLVEYVVEALELDNIERIGVVVSRQNEKAIKDILNDRVDFIIQDEQLGTGHAVMAAHKWLESFEGKLVVVVGDAPFLMKRTIRELLDKFEMNSYACLLLSAIYKNPPPYGRVLRNDKGILIKIVEERDTTEKERRVKEVSSSHYCFDKTKLFSALEQIKNNNAQGEYYLPDVIEVLIKNGEKVDALPVSDPMITFGINSQKDLEMAQRLILKSDVKL
jgi:bifunctional UDP-N-acetylglucosamine pyrophosphorylase/glucosamine-1-phosphate N-acetyltransferase